MLREQQFTFQRVIQRDGRPINGTLIQLASTLTLAKGKETDTRAFPETLRDAIYRSVEGLEPVEVGDPSDHHLPEVSSFHSEQNDSFVAPFDTRYTTIYS